MDGDVDREDGGNFYSSWRRRHIVAKGDRVGNSELLDDGVCLGNQGSVCAERGRVVHLGVVTFEGRVSGDEVREVRVTEEVSEGELILCDEWWCEQEGKTEGRRRRGGVFYNPPGRTLHVSTPARLSRSLLRPSTLSIGSRTCVPMGNQGDVESS